MSQVKQPEFLFVTFKQTLFYFIFYFILTQAQGPYKTGEQYNGQEKKLT